MNGQTNVLYTRHGILLSYNKEGELCYDTDEPQKHAKWKKLDTKDHIL